MTRRNIAMVIVLTFVTCGIYWFFWFYNTTVELKRTSGRAELNPGVDLALAIVTCSLWGLYALYRNAQIAHATLAARGVPHQDHSQLILILNIVALVVGVTSLVSMGVLQDDFNHLADADTVRPVA